MEASRILRGPRAAAGSDPAQPVRAERRDTRMKIEELRAFFPESAIDWRVTAMNKEKTRGLVACYVDARAVMDRLDQVCGAESWQDEYRTGPAGGVICRLGILTISGWVWKEDGAENTDVEPVKGGVSDAFKRAAVKWGIGRYLYEVPSFWVDLDEFKKPKERPKMPKPFLPLNDAVNRDLRSEPKVPPPDTNPPRKSDGGQSKAASTDHATAADFTARLYRPAGGGPFPAVVLLHGCHGVLPAT